MVCKLEFLAGDKDAAEAFTLVITHFRCEFFQWLLRALAMPSFHPRVNSFDASDCVNS